MQRELGYAESWWLICEWHSRLRVAVHCGRNLHQRCMGQFLYVLLTAKTHNEVVFKTSDGSFCCVLSMEVRGTS